MNTNRFIVLMAAFPFVLYACGSDDSGDGTGGKKDAGADSGNGGTGGGTGGTGGVAIGGTGGLTGGTGGIAGSGGVAGSGGGVAGSGGGVAGAAGGGGLAGAAGGGGTAGVAGASGGTAGSASGGADAGTDASTGGSAGTDGGTALLGDTCGNPFQVGSIPYTATGDTTGAAANYGFSANACTPLTFAAGSGAADQVYAFTPTVSGRYLAKLTGNSWDSTLYVVTDCQNVNTTCLWADDDGCGSCTELASINAQAGSTYYIIVDGYQTSPSTTTGAYTLDVVNAPANETCATAIPVGNLPYQHTSTTVGATADYGFPANTCPGNNLAKGAGAGDLVYSFTPATSGPYIISIATGDFDAALYVTTSCSPINSTTCVGVKDSCFENCSEAITLNATAGTTYYIFVDGFETTPTPGNSGDYTLYVAPPPPGDTCATAIPVPSVPFTDSGNTVAATGQYGYPTGACPPETGGWGSGANDIVYSFTPATTASYTISLGASFDSTIYVVTSCADIATTCVAGDEHCFEDTTCNETVTPTLTAGTTYYIVVDGYGTTSNQAGPYTLDIVQNP